MCRALLRCLLVLGLLLAPGTQLGAAEPPDPSAAHTQEIWAVERDFRAWAGRADSKDLDPAAASQARASFLERLRQLEQRLPPGPELGCLRQKVSAVADTVDGWSPASSTTLAGDPSRRPTVFEPPEAIRTTSANDRCNLAEDLGIESVTWDAAYSSTAWFRFTAPARGWYLVHTAGSTADLKVDVYSDCGREPMATDDDGHGLQALAAFEARAGGTYWIRAEALAAEWSSSVMVTVEGTGGGTISGLVTDETTGLPITSVRVNFYRSNGSYYSSDWTDSQGVFLRTGLPEDSYFVLTDDTDEYLDELWDDRPCEPTCSIFAGDPVPVSDAVPGLADFALSPGGSISGLVLETGGGPVQERIYLTDFEGNWLGSDFPDASGQYKFSGLLPGTYFAYSDSNEHRNEVWDDIPCEGNCQPTNGHPIVVVGEQETGGVNFVLDRLGIISGRVTDDATGLPIQSLRVEVFDAGGFYQGRYFTDANGEWRLGGFDTGTYFVATDSSAYRNEVFDDMPCSGACLPTSGTPLFVEVNSELTGVDFALDRLGSISGATSESASGSGLPFVRVELYDAAGGSEASTFSSTLGYYEFTGLEPGTYYVVTDDEGQYLDELFDDIQCSGGPSQGCLPTDGTPVAVELSSTTEDIDFGLELGGFILGGLYDATTGAELTDQDVVLTGVSPSSVRSLESNPLGRFVFFGLPSGTYYLHTQSDSHANEIWDGLPCSVGCDPTTGTPIEVQAGSEHSGFDFDLTLLGGITGQIRDEAGTALGGVLVYAWNSAGQVVATGASDSEGTYQLDLPSGVFYFSTTNALGLPDELWNDIPCPGGPASQGGCDPLAGDAVVVIGAEPVLTGFDFELGPTIFADGFESGDTSMWSTVVP